MSQIRNSWFRKRNYIKMKVKRESKSSTRFPFHGISECSGKYEVQWPVPCYLYDSKYTEQADRNTCWNHEATLWIGSTSCTQEVQQLLHWWLTTVFSTLMKSTTEFSTKLVVETGQDQIYWFSFKRQKHDLILILHVKYEIYIGSKHLLLNFKLFWI